jgi:hypothetical protein
MPVVDGPQSGKPVIVSVVTFAALVDNVDGVEGKSALTHGWFSLFAISNLG